MELDASRALELLKEGNKRFVSGNLAAKDFNKRRLELLGFQKPFATILSCSDSRVVPEFIFDCNIGDIFVIRNAGNLALDKITLGSLEYGCEHLKTPLLVILAHQSCGAVCATCDSKGKSNEGNLKHIIKTISKPAKEANFQKEQAILNNAKNSKETILKKSKIISHLVDEKKLNIVIGYYSFESGEVKFLE
jgi:carbonic anhydrase